MLLCPIGSGAPARNQAACDLRFPVEQGRAVLEERGDAIVAGSAGVVGEPADQQ
jgi:hypothetical protein